MSWEIVHLEAERTLLITTSGRQDMAMAMQMAAEAASLAARLGLSRFLKDDRQAVLELSTLELYKLPQLLMDVGIPRHSRIALVMARVSPQLRDFSFFKTRMYNMGMREVQIFLDSKDEAMNWLTA